VGLQGAGGGLEWKVKGSGGFTDIIEIHSLFIVYQ